MRTLQECLREIYEEVLSVVRRRLEVEALTERELWKELRKYIESFESYYLNKYGFFCEETQIWEEFSELVKSLDGIEVRKSKLLAEFPTGLRIPVEIRLYGYPKNFDVKKKALMRNPFYLVKQQNLRE